MTNKLKTEMLKYWRFKRGYSFCATEVHNGFEIADILVSNGNQIIEIEIKTSYSDFLADFKNKFKHKYKNEEKKYYHLKANKFYFCVSADIKEKCLKYLTENNYEYGLYSFNGHLENIKKCKKLKKLTENEICRLNDYIIKRATSELINLRIKNEIQS